MEPETITNTVAVAQDLLEIDNDIIYLRLKKLGNEVSIIVKQRDDEEIAECVDAHYTEDPEFEVRVGGYPELCRDVIFVGRSGHRRASLPHTRTFNTYAQADAYFQTACERLRNIFALEEAPKDFKTISNQDFLKEFL